MQKIENVDGNSFPEKETLLCLVCDTHLSISTSLNIFYTTLPKNGNLLATLVLRILRPHANDLCSSFLCSQCYELFKALDQAQQTVNNVSSEILRVYRSKNASLSVNNETRAAEDVEDEEFDQTLPKILENVPSDVFQEELGSNMVQESEDIDSRFNIQRFEAHRMQNLNLREEKERLEECTAECYQKNGIEISRDEDGDPNKFAAESNQRHETENLTGKDLNLKKSIESNESEEMNPFGGMKITKTDKLNEIKFEKCDDELLKKFCTNIKRNKEIAFSTLGDETVEKNDLQINVSETSIISNSNKETSKQSQSKSNQKNPKNNSNDQKHLKYSCQTCNKKWRTSAELRTHEKSHSMLRPYMCEICGQAYKHKNALEIHIGMHNGVSPFKCSICDKCFTQKGALMRHLPMHTGEFPYQCELCGKRFVHHTSYNMHSLSHTGKKSYQCQICDLLLLSTSHLKRHMRVHTGEKPYSCSLCGKSFAERYNLFAHQKIHDPGEIDVI